MNTLNEGSLEMSNQEILDIVKASITTLYKKNKKFIDTIESIKKDEEFSDKQ